MSRNSNGWLALLCVVAVFAGVMVDAQSISSVTISPTSGGGTPTVNRGQQYTVSWSSSSVTQITLRLCSSSSCSTIYDSVGPMTNLNTYDYTIGGAAVYAPTGSAYIDIYSSSTVRSGKSVTVAPQTSSIYAVYISTTDIVRGESSVIHWSQDGTITAVNISLWRFSTFIRSIADLVDASSTQYTWDPIDPTIPNTYSYSIKIVSSRYDPVHDSVTGYSSDSGGGGVYDVVASDSSIYSVSPGIGSNDMIRGRTYTLTWSTTGDIYTVRIEMIRFSTINYVIAANTSNTGSYQWQLPANATNSYSYQIRVTSIYFASKHDQKTASSSTYDIDEEPWSITISNPADMIRGVATPISWTYTGMLYTVNVSIWRFSTFYTWVARDYALSSSALTQTITYTLPQLNTILPTSYSYQVKIIPFRYAPQHDPVDKLSTSFDIDPPACTLKVTVCPSCTTGNVRAGISRPFTFVWTVDTGDTQCVTAVSYQYCRFSTCTAISGATSVTGSFTWILPSSVPPTYSYTIRATAATSSYSVALDAAPSADSETFEIYTTTEYDRLQANSGNGGSSSDTASSGGGGGGAAGGIIGAIVVVGIIYYVYNRQKSSQAGKDFAKMGVKVEGEAKRAEPTPEDQYVTEGIPLCYFNQTASLAPAQPISVVAVPTEPVVTLGTTLTSGPAPTS